MLSSCSTTDAPPAVEGDTEAEETALEEPPQITPAWIVVTQRDLDEKQSEALRRAVSARTSLGAKLIGTLVETIETLGPEAAVVVCKEQAPQFAVDIGHQYGVAVGRSSLRLRNSGSLPPAWAIQTIEENEAKDYIFVGPDHRVGTLTPILTGELCTRCHGPADTIEESVLATLQQEYPLDQATGFSNGDLRGWFWVEAPLIEEPPVYFESQPDDLDELWMHLAVPSEDVAPENTADAPEDANSAP